MSAYLDKFVQRQGKDFFSQDVITDIYHYKKQNFNSDHSISFEDFVRYLCRTKDLKLNVHWKPQYLFLSGTKFDFIGRIENLKSDFEYLKKKLNLPYELPQNNSTQYKKTLAKNPFKIHCSQLTSLQLKNINYYPTYDKFYTEELVQMVRNRYAQDIKMFDYTFNI